MKIPSICQKKSKQYGKHRHVSKNTKENDCKNTAAKFNTYLLKING